MQSDFKQTFKMFILEVVACAYIHLVNSLIVMYLFWP